MSQESKENFGFDFSSDLSSEKESVFSLLIGSVVVVGLILVVLFGAAELLV